MTDGGNLRRRDDDFGIDELLVKGRVLALLVVRRHERVTRVFEPLPDPELVLDRAQQLRYLEKRECGGRAMMLAHELSAVCRTDSVFLLSACCLACIGAPPSMPRPAIAAGSMELDAMKHSSCGSCSCRQSTLPGPAPGEATWQA